MYRSKNPYKTRIEKDETGKEHYYVSFKDGMGITHDIEISYELYLEFKSFESEHIREANIFQRYIEHMQLSDSQLHKRAMHQQKSVEDIVVDKTVMEILERALSELPEIQRRRLILYYIHGLTYEEIAKIEGLSKVAIKYAIDKAMKRIRKNLKNFKLGG